MSDEILPGNSTQKVLHKSVQKVFKKRDIYCHAIALSQPICLLTAAILGESTPQSLQNLCDT